MFLILKPHIHILVYHKASTRQVLPCVNLYFTIFEKMKNTKTFTTFQLSTLVLLRLLIGWQILYEGISKLIIPNWSSAVFLRESQWILKGFADWIISHDGVLHVVDFMNTWGLIAIGLGLILGLFTRLAAFAGATLVFLYYLNSPPLLGLEYSLPVEGNCLIFNKTLIEAIALIILAAFPTGSVFGLDMFMSRFAKSKTQKI